MAFVLIALAGSAFAVTLFGPRTYHWRAFDVEVSIHPTVDPATRIRFIPLGEVRAATHSAPVALQISLTNIEFEKAKQLITKPPPREELEREFTQMAKEDLNGFAVRQLLFGALGGLVAPLMFRSRRARLWLAAAVIGGGFVAVVFAITVRTFDRKAFESPTYTGSLHEARWIIGLAKDGFNKVEALSEKLRNVAANINRLYERIDAVPTLSATGDVISVLHISDIHNNPSAVEFVRELVRGSKVDLVIDTGDLTDFGSPLEAELSKEVAAIPKPYVFVAGNHDSPEIIRAVQRNHNAIILNGVPVDAAGLTILGSPDPSSAKGGANNVDTSPEALKTAGEGLANAFMRAPKPPDIVCVHDPLQAAPLLGKAALVLCGHEHRAYIEERQGTFLCNAGTTGGAGLRYLDRSYGVPFSAEILCFSKAERPQLLYADQVVLDGSLGKYSISRRTFRSEPKKSVGLTAVPSAQASNN